MLTHRFVGEVISEEEITNAILIFVILKVLDAFSTFILLMLGGYEMNPIISFVINDQPLLYVFSFLIIVALFKI